MSIVTVVPDLNQTDGDKCNSWQEDI